MTTPVQTPPENPPPVSIDTQPSIWVAFDVDGTLYDTNGQPRWDIIELLRTTAKYARIIVWSGAGPDYARHKGQALYLPPGIHYTAKLRLPQPVHLTYDDQEITLGHVNIRV